MIGQQNQQTQQSPSKIGGGIPQPSSALNRSTNAGGGGISSNSFRARFQGFGQGAGNQTNIPQSQNSGSAASNQDLQKRLADMKAKLQGLKK